MDIKDSIYVDVRDFLKAEVAAGVGVKLWPGRYPDEMQTGRLRSSRPGTDAPFRIVVAVSDLKDEFLPGNRAWLSWKPGYPADGPGTIDLYYATLEEFRAWLGEVKAEAQRWS